MPVVIKLSCGGCGEEVSLPLRPRYEPVPNGAIRRIPSVNAVAGDVGWWAFDPWTAATYCPDCRDDIENGGSDE